MIAEEQINGLNEACTLLELDFRCVKLLMKMSLLLN